MKLEPFNEGKLLEGLYQMQTFLIDNYKDLGHAHIDHPAMIQTYEGQSYIREVMGHIIEELAEADEVYQKVLIIFRDEKWYESRVRLTGLLQDFNEEIIDSLHFVLELMIYCNIQPNDILSYYETVMEERKLDAFKFDDGLSTSCAYAAHTNYYDDRLGGIKKSGIEIIEGEFPGKYVSLDLYQEQQLCLWKIVQTMKIAGNLLKMKRWKLTPVETDVKEYQKRIMVFWLYYFKYLDLLDYNPTQIYTQYAQKFEKNQKRISTGY